MILAERHQIEATPELVRLCTLSRKLYNACNYLMRQAFLKKEKLPNLSSLWHHFKRDPLLLAFSNTTLAQQVMIQCLSDWSSFFKLLKIYKEDKTKCKGFVSPPGYKKKLNQLTFHGGNIKWGQSKKRHLQTQITAAQNLFSIPSLRDYKTVVVCPGTFGFVVNVNYEATAPIKHQPTGEQTKEPGTLCIDLGVNNLCAITSDQLAEPILVNGRIVKSINQQYNKNNRDKENIKKRYWRMENYFHHTSKMVINLCIKNNIRLIVIGKTAGWKNEPKLGKKNNQSFHSIPHDKLIEKIKYKAKMTGIEVVVTEESYTSKASFLDHDPLPAYQKGVTHSFSGKRVTRGLYQASNGRIINADLNGSANIGRKVIQNRNFVSRLGRSLAARPRLVNPLKTFCI